MEALGAWLGTTVPRRRVTCDSPGHALERQASSGVPGLDRDVPQSPVHPAPCPRPALPSGLGTPLFEPAGKVTGPPCQRPCVCVPGTWLLGTPQTPIGSKRPGHCDLELSGVVSGCWGPQMEAAGNFSQTHCVPSSASTPSFCVPASLLPPPPSCLGAPAHTCRTSGHPPPSPERWGRRFEPPGQSVCGCVWGGVRGGGGVRGCGAGVGCLTEPSAHSLEED